MSQTMFRTHTNLQAKLLFVVLSDLYIFRQQTIKQDVLNWMVASITRIKSAFNVFIDPILIWYCRSETFELRHISKGAINSLLIYPLTLN
jgi:hypothetical protein